MKNHFLHQKLCNESVQQLNTALKYLKSINWFVNECDDLQDFAVYLVCRLTLFSVWHFETFKLNGYLIAKVFCILQDDGSRPFDCVCVRQYLCECSHDGKRGL